MKTNRRLPEGSAVSSGSVILLNIGNTHTQIGMVENGLICESRRVSTAMLSGKELPSGLPVIVASVVPAASSRLKKLTPLFIDTAVVPWIDWSKVKTLTLGADRIANAAMLSTSYKLPAVCIDFGTAITFEIVGDGPCFQGGSISPGRALMRKALHDHTAQLPQLPLSETIPAGFGLNTVDAMIAGIDRGAVGMIRELIDQAIKQCGKDTVIVAVGGDRGFFLRHLPFMIDGGDNFTLNGIYKIWEMNHAH